MADREKVINHFQDAIEASGNNNKWRFVRVDVIENAIELLKAQEPVLLKNQHKPGGHFINANSPWISRCPKCGKKIEGKQTRFCKYCGKAVKWG